MKGRVTKKDKKKNFKRRFVTVSQAARLLQLSRRDFRRLCIVKGIYPQEPDRKKAEKLGSGKHKLYYRRSDVNWVSHDPIITQIESYHTHLRKLKHYLGKRQLQKARDLQEFKKPQISLSKVVRERYPSFADAVRDLNDPLTHICLFAALPPKVESSSSVEGWYSLTTGMSGKARSIRERWLSYIARSNSLRLSFISVKGFYFQAEIMGQRVIWSMPFEYVPIPTRDVDYHAMMNFLEFYIVMAGFVLFKLEQEEETKRSNEAEKEDDEIEASAQSVKPIMYEGARKDRAVDAKKKAPLKHNRTAKRFTSLFSKMVFYLNRETPKRQLEFMIKSFGGFIETNRESESITHEIMDRNTFKALETRDYVQPQWIFDCINQGKILHVEPFRPGVKLPPHMSPFQEALAHRAPQEEQEVKTDTEEETSDSEFQADDAEDSDLTDAGEDEPEEDDPEYADWKKKKEEAAAKADVERREKRKEKVDKDAKKAGKATEKQKRNAKKKKEERERIEQRMTMARPKDRKLYKHIQITEHKKNKSKARLKNRFIQMKKDGTIGEQDM